MKHRHIIIALMLSVIAFIVVQEYLNLNKTKHMTRIDKQNKFLSNRYSNGLIIKKKIWLKYQIGEFAILEKYLNRINEELIVFDKMSHHQDNLMRCSK